MKIVLLVPPWSYDKLYSKKNNIFSFAPTQGILPPIGMLSISTYLKKLGYEVSFFDGYFHSEIQILEYVKKELPDIVGISVQSCLWNESKKILEKIKKIKQDIITIIGGPHANLYLKDCLLECDFLDAVVFGEGEAVLPSLLEKLKNNKNLIQLEEIPGLITRNSKSIKSAQIEDLNEIPFPDINILNPNINSYISNVGLYNEDPFATMFTTRGCVMQCAFCNEGNLYKKVRKRSSENILEEIDCLVNKCKVKTINFYDDVSVFSCDEKISFKLCEELIKRKYNFKWTIYLTNFDIEEDLLQLMKKAGCFRIHCAIESGVQKNRDYIRGQHYPLEKIKEKISVIKKIGIEAYGRFMLGIYGETYEDGLETIKYACSLDLDYVSFIKTLLSPGTKMFKDLEQINHVNPNMDTWSYYGDFYKPYPMTQKEVNSLIIKGYREYYINNKNLFKLIKSIDSFQKFKRYAYYFYRLLIDKLH